MTQQFTITQLRLRMNCTLQSQDRNLDLQNHAQICLEKIPPMISQFSCLVERLFIQKETTLAIHCHIFQSSYLRSSKISWKKP